MDNNYEWSSIFLKTYLSKYFSDFIDIPNDLNTVPKYFKSLEEKILLPPSLMRQVNCKKKQDLINRYSKTSRENRLMLKLIESSDFSFKKNPILSRKKNMRNIISISILFGDSKLKHIPSEIITKVGEYLIEKPYEFKKVPKIDFTGFSKYNSQSHNIVFGKLLELGFISHEVFYHLKEYSKYSRDRQFTIPHPAKNSFDFLYDNSINVYDCQIIPPYIPMKKYFESNDDNRLIQDKEDLKEADLILEGISFKVF